MSITDPVGQTHRRDQALGPQLLLTGALAAVLMVTALFRQVMSNDALLPSVCVSFLVLAAAVTAFAWTRPSPDRNFSYWDVAGVLTAIGIVVSAMIEPEQMVRLVVGERSAS